MTNSTPATPGHQQVRNAGGESTPTSQGSSPAPYPPTQRQLDLLRFIRGYQLAKGYSPSYQEMADALHTNKSRIFDLVTRMAERGLVRSLVQRARAIEVLHPPSIPRDPNGRPLYFVRL